MSRDVSFIPQEPPKKRAPKKTSAKAALPVPPTKIKRVDFEGNAYFLVSHNGKRKQVSRVVAQKALLEIKQPYLPKDCTKVEKEFNPRNIKNVLFLYLTVAYIKTYTGRKVYIPRELADQFLATEGADFLERRVDQPWNNRTVQKLSFDSIMKVVRMGSKDTARVLTTDGVTVLISKKDEEDFLAGETQRGSELLESYGIVVHKKKPAAKKPVKKS